MSSAFSCVRSVLSLARQRTMEDEEEVERERRRRVRSTSSANEPDAEFSTTPSDTPFNDREMSQSPSRLLSQYRETSFIHTETENKAAAAHFPTSTSTSLSFLAIFV